MSEDIPTRRVVSPDRIGGISQDIRFPVVLFASIPRYLGDFSGYVEVRV